MMTTEVLTLNHDIIEVLNYNMYFGSEGLACRGTFN